MKDNRGNSSLIFGSEPKIVPRSGKATRFSCNSDKLNSGSKAPLIYFIQVFMVVFFLSFKLESLRDFGSSTFICFWSVNAITSVFYLISCYKNPGFIASNAFSFDTQVQQNDFIQDQITDQPSAHENYESERCDPQGLSKDVRMAQTQHTLVKNIPSSRLENKYKKKGTAHVPSFKTEFSTYRASQFNQNGADSGRPMDKTPTLQGFETTENMGQDNEKLDCIDFKTEASIKSPFSNAVRYETLQVGDKRGQQYESEQQSPRMNISSDDMAKKQDGYSQFYESATKKKQYLKLSEEQSTKYTTGQERSIRTESRSTILEQHKTLDLSHDIVIEQNKGKESEDDRAKVEYEPMQCTSCDILLPMRAKHCRICGHCVSTFDHHCPWIGQCIGEKNRTLFFVYIIIQFVQLLFAFVLSSLAFKNGVGVGNWFYRNALALLFFLFLLSMTTLQLLLVLFQFSLALRNLTTCKFLFIVGEALSWMKISYMTQWPRKYGSPFNLGWRRNLQLYFCAKTKKEEYYQWKLPKYLPKFGTGTVKEKGVKALLRNHYYHCC